MIEPPTGTSTGTMPAGKQRANYLMLFITCLVLLLVTCTVNLSNCQTNPSGRHATRRQAPLLAEDEPAAAAPTKCNHRLNQDELRDQQVPIYLNQHQQFRSQGRQQRLGSQQQLQHHHQQTGRQQRQFTSNHLPSPRSAAILAAPEGQPPPPPNQPEEFSLSSITNQNQAGGGALVQPPDASPGAAPLNGTSYLMLESSSTTTTTTTTTTTAASPTMASTNAGAAPPVDASSTASTTTEQATPLNTTPALAPDSIGSPVVPQPPATTTSSILQSATSASAGSNINRPQPLASSQGAPSESLQRQQAGRRIEDSSSSLMLDSRHASNLSAGEDQPSSGNQLDSIFKSSSSAAISSSPSSVSIITPLIGPPTQHQQTTHQHSSSSEHQAASSSSSSSMIKPIYVVGNPLAELDYTSTTYSQQSTASNKAASGPTTSVRPVQRTEKRVDEQQPQTDNASGNATLATYAQHEAAAAASAADGGERMNGPALVYSDGHLVANAHHTQHLNATLPTAHHQQHQSVDTPTQQNAPPPSAPIPPPSPRLFQGPMPSGGAAAVLGNTPRRPSLPPPVNQANAASGFRSPMSPSGPLVGQPALSAAANQLQQQQQQQQQTLQAPVNQNLPNFYQTSPPYAGGGGQLFSSSGPTSTSLMPSSSSSLSNKQAFVLSSSQKQQQQQLAAAGMPTQFQLQMQQPREPQASITNQQAGGGVSTQLALGGSGGGGGPSRRPLNITRVEHISAECSNDLIRAIIVFNGTFKGIIYSSGYVNDPTCLYVNGTGLTRYEFSIRLNQCGTLGRQELHQPTIPGEARRRDQVMWNTLSIQYNPVIEQEWDEHFRVSCEYGSDFWKTISFSPFNVETNTGAPVVFTINPPQCQMDVLLGHGMGPKIVDGPVTVGDPLTLLIHMKSEKAGYDILVKNCVAHNGGKQRMQLIDSNGCVVNERFISPFRGTYNDNDLRHVTLYAYLKAFRFTGSPVLYLECEIHMCQSACPPQMCYWRRLSKRSVDNDDFEYTDDRASLGNLTRDGDNSTQQQQQPIISDSLSLFKALQVRHEPIEPAKARRRAQQLQEIYAEDDESQLVCYRHAEVLVFMTTMGSLLLLVLTVAITCCLRIRKLTRNQFKHNKLAAEQHHHQQQRGQSTNSLISQSLSSPSLLSISDALSQVGSYADHSNHNNNHHCRSNGLVSPTGSYCATQPPLRPAAKPSPQQVAAAFCLPQETHHHGLLPHNHSRQFNSGHLPTSTQDIYTTR